MNCTPPFSNRSNEGNFLRGILAILLAVVSGSVFTACRDDAPPVVVVTRDTPASTSTPLAATSGGHGAPAADAVQVAAEQVRLAPGMSGEAVVRLTIAKPLHVNANPATHSYLIPTQLTVQSAATEGITAGAPAYPEAVERKFAFDESLLRVYEGTAEIKLPLNVAKDAPHGERALSVRVRVQPCDDEVCYPPRTLEATITVVIVK